MAADINWNPDSDASHETGDYTLGFSLTVLQSECQQLICEILRATPEAKSTDVTVQTARLASKAPSKDKRMSGQQGGKEKPSSLHKGVEVVQRKSAFWKIF